ncbi:uncharacterized protein LOC141854857 [Brevipalpus obovatus]|uniref:uncharacterized protein LOC141854857 n=1 Tax=Brevipalpus obovatus TaxID=246614 RepID=UPI003D9E99DC
MGRRSINTTKSGKYMNPTDQARKEARKRELKKNKKQRMLVRTAVLKGKDPHQVLADMERLDQMEYSVDAPPPLNEKVLRDKRRKLKETWDRLCRLYSKEENERYQELKRLEGEYESKRDKMVKFYEAVRSAQEVSLDDIPLPAGPPELEKSGSGEDLETKSFPTASGQDPTSILKRNENIPVTRTPPGLPSGPPPCLDEFEDGDSNDDDEEDGSKKVRFAGDHEKEADINEFLKEIEDVERTAIEVTRRDQENIPENKGTEKELAQTSENPKPFPLDIPGLTPSPLITSLGLTKIQPAPPSGPPPSLLLIRPPPQMPSGGRPGMIPPPPSLMMPNQHFRPPMGPRLGPQPRPNTAKSLQHQRMPQSRHSANQPHRSRDEKKFATSETNPSNPADRVTIAAKPQLRNLAADATRFMPVSLKVRREDKVVKKPVKGQNYEQTYGFVPSSISSQQDKSKPTPTKDDAYEEFMKELKGIL